MSINIDKKLFRKAIDLLNIAKAMPLWWQLGTGPTIDYDGEWLTITGVAGQYPAIGTGYSCPALEGSYILWVEAIIKITGNQTNIYVFFLEPRKAQYDYYQGFQHDGSNHVMTFRDAGAEEEDIITGQDWTQETKFTIKHRTDQTYCQGYINGALKAECTDANKISAQPFSVYCCEPNALVRTAALKYPPGIYMGA